LLAVPLKVVFCEIQAPTCYFTEEYGATPVVTESETGSMTGGIMRTRKAMIIVLTVFVPALAGCGETDRPLSYEKGNYAGESDQKLTSEQVDTLRQRGMRVYQ
jgi:hypothetical protein